MQQSQAGDVVHTLGQLLEDTGSLFVSDPVSRGNCLFQGITELSYTSISVECRDASRTSRERSQKHYCPSNYSRVTAHGARAFLGFLCEFDKVLSLEPTHFISGRRRKPISGFGSSRMTLSVSACMQSTLLLCKQRCFSSSAGKQVTVRYPKCSTCPA